MHKEKIKGPIIKMHILHIPSWYPTKNYPLSGIFIKEQIEAISLFSHDTKNTVISWGHEESQFRVRSPMTYFSNRSTLEPYGKITKKFVNEVNMIISPATWWSNRLPFGGASVLLKSARKCLIAADDPIDIIHAHVSYPAGYIAYELSKEFNIPFIITEHMGIGRIPDYMKNGKPINQIRDAYRESSASISVSTFLKDHLMEIGLPITHIVPNLVNEDKFLPVLKNNNKFIFLLMSNLSFQKGIDTFLEAAARVKKSNLECEFWIAGSGPDESKLKAMSKSLGLENSVFWLGHISRKNAPDIFQQSDVFVLPSRFETFGVVYAEALGCGKPVIATRCGGPLDIVNSKNGLLIDINDIEQLGDAMKKMYKKYSFFNQNSIRMSFLDKFSRSAVVSKIIKIYKEVLEM